MSILEKSLKWLRKELKKSAGEQVIYRRGAESWVLDAVPGKTRFGVSDVSGVSVESASVDFLIDFRDFPCFPPERGDRVLRGGNCFEVLNLGGETDTGCWSWADAAGSMIRVHTKQVEFARYGD